MTEILRRRHRHPRGFAMLAAIAMVGLVAVAMAAAASIFRLDLRRTADSLHDAQARQLLLAGERAVRARLGNGVPTGDDFDVQLPVALRAEGAVLHARLTRAGAEDTVEATVESTLAGRMTRQTLRYRRGSAGWQIVSAVQVQETR